MEPATINLPSEIITLILQYITDPTDGFACILTSKYIGKMFIKQPYHCPNSVKRHLRKREYLLIRKGYHGRWVTKNKLKKRKIM
jgi:hypothetical protein